MAPLVSTIGVVRPPAEVCVLVLHLTDAVRL
jgi:hypothetical protein